MNRAARMRTILEKELQPSVLEIRDDSDRHKHHAHARSLQQDERGPQQIGETHYTVHIISRYFNDLRPLARHRVVNQLLADEFATGLHALSLSLEGE